MRQIEEANLVGEVEVLSAIDDGERSTGHKRNALLRQATGRFVASIDDDDLVSHDYVRSICAVIRSQPDVDCIGFVGVITFRGRHARTFTHSLAYTEYSSRDGVYTRPPYHLNPIRRDIAVDYEFLDVSYSEDYEWSSRVRRDPRMRREALIDTVLYTYRSRRHWWYQWLLDRSERLRHALGLRLTNRFRVYSALRRRARAAVHTTRS